MPPNPNFINSGLRSAVWNIRMGRLGACRWPVRAETGSRLLHSSQRWKAFFDCPAARSTVKLNASGDRQTSHLAIHAIAPEVHCEPL